MTGIEVIEKPGLDGLTFDAAGNGGTDFSGIIQHVRSLAGK